MWLLLLVRVGVLDPGDLPVVGADQARAMVDSSVADESHHRRHAVGRARGVIPSFFNQMVDNGGPQA